MHLHFVKGKVLRNGFFVDDDLWVANGEITDQPQKDAHTIDASGQFLAPGLIDLQINGAFGYDVTRDPRNVVGLAEKLPQFGVTSFLATVVSSPPADYLKTIPFLEKQIGKTPGAELLGIHLEGPCFNLAQSKAHDPKAVHRCAEFPSPENCYGSLRGVKMVTLAPEIAGGKAWIEKLVTQGIIVSVGHTVATAEQMEEAMGEGVSMATHLFNGMGPFLHRAPGVVGAVLAKKGFCYSIIVDGVHVDPRAVKIAWNAQPDGLILVSDDVAVAGMPSGDSTLGSLDITTVKGIARVRDTGMLAGGSLGLGGNVGRFCQYTGASLADAVRAASEKPAKLLRIYPKKGSLVPGADADITVFDHDFRVVDCYTKGKKA